MIEILIDKLIKLNIGLKLIDGNSLEISTDIEEIPNDILQEIKFKKYELIEFLKEQVSTIELEPIVRFASSDGGYPLSSSQRRLWILCSLGIPALPTTSPGCWN